MIDRKTKKCGDIPRHGTAIFARHYAEREVANYEAFCKEVGL